MKRNCGKGLWIVLLGWMIPILLLAGGVQLSVDKKEVVRGDTVTFTIKAQGENVEFPTVREVGGFPILGTGQSSNIEIVNGSVRRSISKSYTFAPMKDVTIPSLTVKVDGKSYTTQPVTIHVIDKPTNAQNATAPGASLKLEVNKHRVHVGEPIEMKVTLRYPRSGEYVRAQMERIDFPDFWIKQVGNPEQYVQGDSVVEVHRYVIFPQKAGHYTLGPVTAKLARKVRMKSPINDPFFANDPFFSDFFTRLQWTRIASNSVEVDADPLPGGVDLYGDFTIRATVDKRQVHAGKPVNVTVHIEGEGNVEDIEKFNPDIPNAVVYAEEPVVKEWVKNGVYGGSFTQKITIVADGDYTIPPFTIRYYDKKSHKVVERKTRPIPIHVIGGHKAPPAATQVSKPSHGGNSVQRGTSQVETPSKASGGFAWWWILAGFIGGVGVSVGAVWLMRRWRSVRERRRPNIVQKILRAKDDRELFELLLPYAADDEEIAEAVRKLEENLYKGAKNSIDKRVLAGIVEEIEER